MSKTAPDTSAVVIADRLLFGQYPNSDSLKILKEYGITTLVDLTGLRQIKKDDRYDSTGFVYLRYPIKDRKCPANITKFKLFLSDLLLRYQKGENIYLHCVGGHGRAGMITSILVKLILNVDVEEALKLIYEAHQKRPDMKEKWRKLGSPQTQIQFAFVRSYFSSKVDFYAKDCIYFEFSNFYPTKVIIDDNTYPSTEHYYQSQKFIYEGANEQTQKYAKIVSEQTTPGKALYLAKQIKRKQYKWMYTLNDIIDLHSGVKIDPNWEKRKLEVMEKALRIKFKQSILKELLLDTRGKEIREASPRDWYWGIGKDENGENHLGKLLMKIRDETE